MLTSGFGPATRLSLGAATLIALIVAAMGALHARQASAANGDPVLVYGGSVAGSGAQDVTIAPGASGNYVVSMTVPAGEDIAGLYLSITYDSSKFSSVTCATPTPVNGQQFVCNPIANGGTEVRVLAAQVTNPPPAGFGSGTFTLATVTFNAAPAATNTANAISNVTILGCDPVGAPGDSAVTCSETPANLGKLVIGTGGGGNACTVSSVNMISGLNGTILWTGSAISLANMAAQLPANVTQVFEFTFAKQGHAFWFRSNPGSSDMANGIQPGHFYIIRSNASATLNIPNPNTFVPPGTGNLNAQTALNPGVWLNSTVATGGIAAALPTQITQLFHFTTAKGGYQFWFRSNPGGSDLSGGLTQCGGFLARSNTSNTLVTGFLTPP